MNLLEVEFDTKIRILEEKVKKLQENKPHTCPPCMLPHFPAQPSPPNYSYTCPFCGRYNCGHRCYNL